MVWSDEYKPIETSNVVVFRLRKKLEQHRDGPYILTYRSGGYSWASPPNSTTAPISVFYSPKTSLNFVITSIFQMPRLRSRAWSV